MDKFYHLPCLRQDTIASADTSDSENTEAAAVPGTVQRQLDGNVRSQIQPQTRVRVAESNQTISTAGTTSSPTATTIPQQNTGNASLSLNYLFAKDLTGSIVYTLLYQTQASISGGCATGLGDVVTNQLEFLLTKHF
jgi:hypothetical protein